MPNSTFLEYHQQLHRFSFYLHYLFKVHHTTKIDKSKFTILAYSSFFFLSICVEKSTEQKQLEIQHKIERQEGS